MPPVEYVQLLKKEISHFEKSFSNRCLDTVYFGGGTPSLLDPQHIVSILEALANSGFKIRENAEVTIEINPATIDEAKMELYLSAGINRFSVGAQSFNDKLLKSVHREHNAAQTRETLKLLKKYHTNFSFDILFALPSQTTEDLQRDLDEVAYFEPAHVSPYCLTVPESHPLWKLKLEEDIQLTMFQMISQNLKKMAYEQYEISNFAKNGYHSRHNFLYWDQSDYWGIGLSAHSFSRQDPSGNWGLRYWNPSNINDYQEWIEGLGAQGGFRLTDSRAPENYEVLEAHQALTDFCHTSLRTLRGLDEASLENQFGRSTNGVIRGLLEGFQQQGQVKEYLPKRWRLTDEGILISNQIFGSLTFLRGEISGLTPNI